MPTVGWIREGDWEAFLEATEPATKPGPPLPPSYHCPFCIAVLPSVGILQSHVSAEHFVARPLVLVGGKELTEGHVIRSQDELKSLAIANATKVDVAVNGGACAQVQPLEVARQFAKLEQAEVSIVLSNASQARGTPVVTHYDFSIRIAKPRLKRVHLGTNQSNMESGLRSQLGFQLVISIRDKIALAGAFGEKHPG
jgi:hypothetical protein